MWKFAMFPYMVSSIENHRNLNPYTLPDGSPNVPGAGLSSFPPEIKI
jgi:hypothetical protein